MTEAGVQLGFDQQECRGVWLTCGPCRGLGKPSEAEPLCRRALRIREQAYGAESPNVATALTALADVLKEMSRCGSFTV